MQNDSGTSKRRRFLLQSIASCAILPNCLSLSYAAPNGYGIEGHIAPELDVAEWIDGEGRPTEFKLADHRGKFVLIECWQAWCPGCHSHGFPTLQKIYAEFENSENFVPIAIQTVFEGFSSNTSDKLQTMQKRYKLPIVMGHDSGDRETHARPKTMVDYRTGGTPWAILISPKGGVIYNDYGMDGDRVIEYLHSEISKLKA